MMILNNEQDQILDEAETILRNTKNTTLKIWLRRMLNEIETYPNNPNKEVLFIEIGIIMNTLRKGYNHSNTR